MEIHHLSKSFPGVKALDDVSLAVRPGEVHALCGENGAGKSTLMHILSGNLHPETGKIVFDGKELRLKDPLDAFRSGISIVHQHLSLTDTLSVAENIFANRQPVTRWGLIDFERLYRESSVLLERLQIDVDPKVRVGTLSAGQKQMVEIAKALAREPKLLILDEPTASVTDKEVSILFRIIGQLRAEGRSVIYISHRLNEIFEIADTITVLKDGVLQGTWPARDLTRDSLIRLMVGRNLQVQEFASHRGKEVLLEARNLSNSDIHALNLKLHKGEILGMAGLVGAGRTEIARLLFGADPPRQGELLLNQEPVKVTHPENAILNGIFYLPEDRKTQSLFPHMSIEETLFSARLTGKVMTGKVRQFRESAAAFVKKLRVATPDTAKKVAQLSGGNQQKVFLAKLLLGEPKVLIADEPTHGIDIGAKHDVYNLLRQLAAEGRGIILISSELPELLTLCDRILVIRDKKIAGSLSRNEASESRILELAMGSN